MPQMAHIGRSSNKFPFAVLKAAATDRDSALDFVIDAPNPEELARHAKARH